MSAPTPSPPTGRPLLVEVAVPVALGLLVLVAGLGMAVAVADQAAPGLVVPVALVTVLALVVALGAWIAWVLRDTALGPLVRLRAGLRGLEEGDFDTRIDPGGAREFRQLAESFNRTVAFLGHQRERLKALAAMDALTGLTNLRSLHEQLRGAVERTQRGGGALGVVALDLDGFKDVNDEHGHARGDEILKAVGEALRGAVRDGDLAARHSGDEFVLALHGRDAGEVRQLAGRAREAVVRALPRELRLECSAGVVLFPGEADAEADLVELAGAALRLAKKAGGARLSRYDADQASNLPTLRRERAEVEALLASPTPVVPVFQPIVELATGRVVGYEALSRFPGEPRRPPDAWFDQAQRSGLGPQLEAVAIAAALEAPGRPQGTYLSLNLSPSALTSSLVKASLPRDLSDVVIEVTEHELAPEDGGLEAGLAELRARGARVAVDDTGSGYAGLQQVMRVQPDLIKLDRTLIADVDTDSAKAALIEFFVVFAKRIGARVCTEGIERPAEQLTLAELGVTLGQGYLLGRPAAPWAALAPEAARTVAAMAVPIAHARERRLTAGPVNRRTSRR